jgi:preprotein translocase subunit SecG
MKRLLLSAIVVCASVPIVSLLVAAQQSGGSLDTMSQDSNQWVMPLGNYSATRHSKLNQINA